MSHVLAKILGIYFLGMGIAFIINPKRLGEIYQMMVKSEIAVFMGGVIALILGAVVVSIHNRWTWGWPVLITILGWWSILKGFLLIAFPNFLQFYSFLSDRSDKIYRGLGIIILLFGLFLTYHGW